VIKVALRALWGRKLRTVLTALAIVLGVATISGTYVLTDSISHAFDAIFSSIYRNTDAVVTGKSAVSKNSTMNLPPFDQSLLAKVRRQSTVAAAIGGVADASTNLIDKNGKVISFGGAPHLGFSVDPKYPAFSSLSLLSGAWPKGGEVVIDHGTARKKHISVGDTIDIEAQGHATPFTVSGLVKFGSSNLDIGGATLAGFQLAAAQKLFNKEGKLDDIRISKKPGVSEAALLAQIRSILPKQTQVRSGFEQAKTDASDTKSFTDFLQTFLLAFGGIALFVGAFVIANSLSITIAQRTREFATLRTIGASRRQIRRAVLLESTVMGVLASVTGLFLGLALAKLLFWLFDAVGFTLPNTGLLFQARTVIVALVVGIGVTIVASLRPAIRATRVPPIAAVREGATLPPGRFAGWRPYISAGLAVLGFASFAYALFGSGLSTSAILAFMGIGALLIFFGVALFSSALVVPLATVLGAPGAHIGGAPGVLARENAQRNPQRTGSTAAALMIGLALVTLVAMLAAGLRSSFFGTIDEMVAASSYAVTSDNNFDPIPTATADPLRASVRDATVVGIRQGDARIFKGTHTLSGIDEGGSKVLSLKWIAGPGDSALESLDGNGAIVDKDFAKEHKLAVGKTVQVIVPSGERQTFVVRGIFKPPAAGAIWLGPVTISSSVFDDLYTQPQDIVLFVSTPSGVTDANTSLLKAALVGFPNAKVQTISQFKTNQAGGLDAVLNVLYVLLALSVIVALFGIVNTLVLTVFERTRELGMLRAVGMTRRQVRRMIRYESVITALIGAAIGMALGIVLAVLLIARVDFVVLSWPVTSLVVFALAAIVAGLIAAILPARRASRLNVLEALQYE
jgi:putative ABC transport system permease protein